MPDRTRNNSRELTIRSNAYQNAVNAGFFLSAIISCAVAISTFSRSYNIRNDGNFTFDMSIDIRQYSTLNMTESELNDFATNVDRTVIWAVPAMGAIISYCYNIISANRWQESDNGNIEMTGQLLQPRFDREEFLQM